MALQIPYNEKTIIYGDIIPDTQDISTGDPSGEDPNITYADELEPSGDFFNMYGWTMWEDGDYTLFTSPVIIAAVDDELSWSRAVIDYTCASNLDVGSTFSKSSGSSPVVTGTLPTFYETLPNVSSTNKSAGGQNLIRYLWLTVRVPKIDLDSLVVTGLQHSYWYGVETVQGHEIFEQDLVSPPPDDIREDNRIGFEYMGARFPYRIMFPKDYDSDNPQDYPLFVSLGGDDTQGLDAGHERMFKFPAIILGGKLNYTYKHADEGQCISIVIQAPFDLYREGWDFPHYLASVNTPYHRYTPTNYEFETEPSNIGDTPPLISEHQIFSDMESYFGEHQWGSVAVVKLIESLISNPGVNIDPNKIHLSAFSGGGMSLWGIALAGRHLFASITELDGGMFWPHTGTVLEPIYTEGVYSRLPNAYLTSDAIDIIMRGICTRLKHIPVFIAFAYGLGSTSLIKTFGELAPFDGFPDEYGFSDELYEPVLYPEGATGLPVPIEGPPYFTYPVKTIYANMFYDVGGFCEMEGPYNGHLAAPGWLDENLSRLFSLSKDDRSSPNPELIDRDLPDEEEDPYPNGVYTDMNYPGDFTDFRILHHLDSEIATDFDKFILVGTGGESTVAIGSTDYVVSIDENDDFIWDKYGDNYHFIHKYPDNLHTYLSYEDETEFDFEIKEYDDFNIVWFGSTAEGCHLFAVDTTKNNQDLYIFQHIAPPENNKHITYLTEALNSIGAIINNASRPELNGYQKFITSSLVGSLGFSLKNSVRDMSGITNFSDFYGPNFDASIWSEVYNKESYVLFITSYWLTEKDSDIFNSYAYQFDYVEAEETLYLAMLNFSDHSLIPEGEYTKRLSLPKPFWDFLGDNYKTVAKFEAPQKYRQSIYADVEGLNRKINLTMQNLFYSGEVLISTDGNTSLEFKLPQSVELPLGIEYAVDAIENGTPPPAEAVPIVSPEQVETAIVMDSKKTNIYFDWEEGTPNPEKLQEIRLSDEFIQLRVDNDGKFVWDRDGDSHTFSGEPGETITRYTNNGKKFSVKYTEEGSHWFEITFEEFVVFYEEAEDIITISSQRDLDVLGLYDTILATIDSSSLSNSKSLKTWLATGYETGKSDTETDIYYYNEKSISFVGELQKITVHEYGSLDEFYNLSGITVSQIFADFSEAAGYPVSPQYIEDIS